MKLSNLAWELREEILSKYKLLSRGLTSHVNLGYNAIAFF